MENMNNSASIYSNNTLGLGWSIVEESNKVHQTSDDGDINASYSNHRTHQAYNIEELVNNKMCCPEPDNKTWNFSLPVLGRMRIVKDPTGLVLSSIIIFYWVYGNWSTWLTILLPRYYDGQMSLVIMACVRNLLQALAVTGIPLLALTFPPSQMLYQGDPAWALLFIHERLPMNVSSTERMYAVVSILCITSFIRASTMSPGKLISSVTPEADWNVCQKCFQSRPPDTHHCRRCGHCVRKMDHHCPWINNCVGEENQFAFMLLVAYAYILSLMTLVLDIEQLYMLPPCQTCDKDSFMMVHQKGIMWTAVVMAIMMTCGGFGLYATQHLSILFDTPSMEWSRMQEEMFRTGKPPAKWPRQTKSMWTVYRTVCGETPSYLWFLPCRRRQSITPVKQFHV